MANRLNVVPVTLQGRRLRLEPLGPNHAQDLAPFADEETFRFFTWGMPRTGKVQDVLGYIERANSTPNVVPFAMVLEETGRAVGSTTYLDIRPEHMGLEIGTTWIGEPYRGGFVNAEAKLLMLRHAFEELGCIRVQLKTDARNLHSQAAIRKLGATYEGTLRRHMLMPDGHMRDTVMFSITEPEWPAVKTGLVARVG